MTYEKIVEKLQSKYANASVEKVDGQVAVQFNVRGEGEGALYIKVAEGQVDVQPYEYYDRNAVVTIDSSVLLEIVDGKTDIESAYNDNRFYVDGDLGAVLLLKNIAVKKPVEKKTAEKKTAAKTTAAKIPAKKTATKKATEKKTTAKKTTTTVKTATTTKKASAEKEVATKTTTKK